MTNKVQKIREEVERLMYGFNLEADIASGEDIKTEELANIKYQLCKKILEYIDSLQEESKQELKIGDRIRFKGVYDEDVVRTITDIQKYDDGSCRYIFADGSIHSISDDKIELIEDSVSEDLEEACDSYYDETWDEHGGKAMVIDGYHDIWFPSHATEDFFKAGAKWQREQINEALLSEVLPCFMHGGEADEVVAKLDEVLNQKK